MNENLDLVEILKEFPEGTKLYSTLIGDVRFVGIDEGNAYPIEVESCFSTQCIAFTKKGSYYKDECGECLLFPSKDQRDWSKFKVPVEKFDYSTLKPFDRVLVRDNNDNSERWRCDLFSHISTGCFRFICVGNGYHYCIPYNDDTKHLVGTTDEAPEFYRHWEG